MTRKEFYLKTIISMAGNPNYVNVTELPVEKEDDGVAYSRILDKDEIMEDADGLLRRVEGVWPDVFDTEPNGDGGPLREHRESLILLLLPHLSLSEPCDGELTACLPR